ncbi:MAG: AGE family epimerase/isomerase [Verrucomicrobiota bacterium]
MVEQRTKWHALNAQVTAILGICLLLAGGGRIFGAEPSAGEFRGQAERCRRILKESLIQFYLPSCVDQENGGYKESLKNNQFVLTGEKFLTLQARQLWFFSTLAIEGYNREESLQAAKKGYAFIQEKMRDPENGGYYSKVTDDGKPKDTRKHVYLNSFVIYGLVAYSRAAHDPEALESAKKLFKTLDAHCHDGEFGGYREFFYADWREVTDAKEQGFVGAIGVKTYNTHLHLLESFAELYRAWPDELLRKRLEELRMINISTVHFPTVNNNVDAYQRDWTVVREPSNLKASYGHDIECIWLVMDASRTMDSSPRLLHGWAEGLAGNVMKFGYDEQHGGFYESGPLGEPASVKRKTWWVQAEALLGTLELYRLTGDASYYSAFAKTLDFCEQNQVAREGGWWATRNADGSAATDLTRSGPWQGAYHAGRALILASHWLDEMAHQTR